MTTTLLPSALADRKLARVASWWAWAVTDGRAVLYRCATEREATEIAADLATATGGPTTTGHSRWTQTIAQVTRSMGFRGWVVVGVMQ